MKRKLLFSAAAVFSLCIASLCGAACVPAGSDEPGVPDPLPPAAVCTIGFEAQTLAFREEPVALSASCFCGKEIRIASLNPSVLRVEQLNGTGFVAYCEGVGFAELCAFHADGTGLSAKIFTVTPGENPGAELADFELYCGESLQEKLDSFGSGFTPAPDQPELELGTNELKVIYNPRPGCYSDYELTVTVTLKKALAEEPERTDWNFSARYFAGMTLADLDFGEPGYGWTDPGLVLSAGKRTAQAYYTPDDGTVERWYLDIPLEIERGTHADRPYPETLSPVIYDEGLTLAGIPLSGEYRWTTPSETPVVAKNTYSAVYCLDEDNFEPLELEIPLTVLPKSSAAVQFPDIPGRVYAPGLRPKDLLAGFDPKFFFLETDPLHGGINTLTLCYRESENYETQTKVVEIPIERAARIQTPESVTPVYADGRLWLMLSADEPFPDDLEFSSDGIVWSKSNVWPAATAQIYCRYGETRDYLAGTPVLIALCPV